MYLRSLVIFFIICPLIDGCNDYTSGYKDGYGSTEKKQWILIGRTEYLDGYLAGEAEKFQQDWISENLTEMNQLQCPVVTILADPSMFVPAEYKRVGTDTYQLGFQ